MRNTMWLRQNGGYFLVCYTAFPSFLFFSQNYKGILSKNWFIRLMKSQNHSSKNLFGYLSLFGFLASILLLFWLFAIYLTMIATISSVYFLASSLPTFQFWTLPLKDVAVYFFGF
jgi:hypothetical protein